jgi:hypothetical protein
MDDPARPTLSRLEPSLPTRSYFGHTSGALSLLVREIVRADSGSQSPRKALKIRAAFGHERTLAIGVIRPNNPVRRGTDRTSPVFPG